MGRKIMKKKKSIRKKAGSNVVIKNKYKALYFPMILALFLLPLIVRACTFRNLLTGYVWNGNTSKFQIDYFLRCKGFALLIIAGLSLFFLLCMILLGSRFGIRPWWMWLPLIYGILAFGATVLSRHRDIALYGASDIHQGFPVLLCYIILFYYSYFMVSKMRREQEENMSDAHRYFLRSILVLSIILGIIGLMQMSGHDPFHWEIVRKLCGIHDAEYVRSSRIYLTLSHPDYAGVVISMLIPVLVSGWELEGKKSIRILYALSILVMLICLLGTQSRSAIFAFMIDCIIVFVMLIIINSMLKDRQKRKMIILSIFGFAVVVLLLISVPFLVNNRWDKKIAGRIFHLTEKYDSAEDGIRGIETGQENTRIYFGKENLFLSWDDENKIELLDETNHTVPLHPCSESGLKSIKKCTKKEKVTVDIRQTDIQETPVKAADLYIIKMYQHRMKGILAGLAVSDGRQIWLIEKDAVSGGYLLMNRQGKLDRSIISSDALPQSFYGFGSYRGYIWSKTLAVLGSIPLYGTGPDTFLLYFPNRDYIGRHGIGYDNIVVDRPHCWYLQMAVETGLFSAMTVFIFLMIYLIEMIRKTYKHFFTNVNIKDAKNRHSEWMLTAGIGMAVFSYMITAIANDSMIVSAPVFWILLGYGSALVIPATNDQNRISLLSGNNPVHKTKKRGLI